MKFKKWMWPIAAFAVIFAFLSVNIVSADHHERENYEEYEKGEGGYFERGEEDYPRESHDYYEEDYDDHDDDYGYGENYGDDDEDGYATPYESTGSQNTFWNIWTRDLNGSTSNNDLPIQEAQDVKIQLNNQSESLYMVPQNGQLLVSGAKMAKLIGVEQKFYEQSKILELSKGDTELVVRAGTNAAYENMIKTPMPTRAFYYENSVYLPVSVIANAFGLRVSWDANKETIILQQL